MRGVTWTTDIIEREVRRGNLIVARLTGRHNKHISVKPASRKPVRMRCGRSFTKIAIVNPPYISAAEFCLPCFISFKDEFAPKARWS